MKAHYGKSIATCGQRAVALTTDPARVTCRRYLTLIGRTA